ncbi:IS66 family transposase, partial [Zarconia navalis]|uniref:IS66 family transposase n=1 Tax=Zarconia navalis TaxID=2992134 RepID=UPI0021F89059
MSERSGVAGGIGQALLRQTKRLFRWWHRVRDGTVSWELFEVAMTRLRHRVDRLLSEAAALCEHPQEKTPLAQTARTCAMILKLEPALWTFVECRGIEPTNNTAERALRSAVIWPRLSFGSDSAVGSE